MDSEKGMKVFNPDLEIEDYKGSQGRSESRCGQRTEGGQKLLAIRSERQMRCSALPHLKHRLGPEGHQIVAPPEAQRFLRGEGGVYGPINNNPGGP